MSLRRLCTPNKNKMHVAGFMSGRGSNLAEIIEQSRKPDSSYRVVVIFSDKKDSKAIEIGSRYNIQTITNDISSFYKENGKPKTDLSVREEFDRSVVRALMPFDVDVAAYAGYMSIATKPLVNAFLGVNVHPADLSITQDGKRKYTGSHATRKVLLAGERELRATTHIVTEEVDAGEILMVSAPVIINTPGEVWRESSREILRLSVEEYQAELREKGDWVIFPKTLEYIANGRFAKDEQGRLYFDGNPIPNGVRLE